MSLYSIEKPTGGVARQRVMGSLREPPGADPHAGWCGDWGRKTPGYPILKIIWAY